MPKHTSQKKFKNIARINSCTSTEKFYFFNEFLPFFTANYFFFFRKGIDFIILHKIGFFFSFYCAVCNSVPQPISLSIAFGKHENRNTLSLMGFRPAEKAASKTRIMTEKCWLLLHTPPTRFYKNFYFTLV